VEEVVCLVAAGTAELVVIGDNIQGKVLRSDLFDLF
jgi:hypothetical protein